MKNTVLTFKEMMEAVNADSEDDTTPIVSSRYSIVSSISTRMTMIQHYIIIGAVVSFIVFTQYGFRTGITTDAESLCNAPAFCNLCIPPGRFPIPVLHCGYVRR